MTRTVGTNCPCGGSAGFDSAGRAQWYCTGYKPPLDTRICLCRCHDRESA